MRGEKMKKIIVLIAAVLLAFSAYGQTSSTVHLEKTVELTGTDTAYVWEPFCTQKSIFQLSTTKVIPSSQVSYVDMTAYIYVDSVAAVQPSADSLLWGIVRIDQDGNDIGDMVYVRFADHDVVSTPTWNSFIPSNRSATDEENMWVDLRGEFENWLGLKHIFVVREAGHSTVLDIKLNVNQVR